MFEAILDRLNALEGEKEKRKVKDFSTESEYKAPVITDLQKPIFENFLFICSFFDKLKV